MFAPSCVILLGVSGEDSQPSLIIFTGSEPRPDPCSFSPDVPSARPFGPNRLQATRQEDHSMHGNASAHTSHFGLSWNLATVSTALLLALLFLIFLLLFMTVTAPPAYG